MSDESEACTFCGIVRREHEADILYRDQQVVAFLDSRPVFHGHALVVPVRHVKTLGQLRDDEVLPLMRVVRALSRADETELGADGSFVAVNNRISQSVPHLHVHVVPRHKGDGLRGFFWPRTKYESASELADYAQRLRVGLARELEAGPEAGA
ncbi:MAG TPA: HIT family protein [Coriobacteriia bacterium]|nr:HIT family protein [Coriobacteriia bacterium]